MIISDKPFVEDLSQWTKRQLIYNLTKTHLMDLPSVPDSKIHLGNMGPTWVLSAPDEPHVGPMKLAIRVVKHLPATGNQVSITMTS